MESVAVLGASHGLRMQVNGSGTKCTAVPHFLDCFCSPSMDKGALSLLPKGLSPVG